MQGRDNQPQEGLTDSQAHIPALNGTNQHRVLRNPDEGTTKHQAIKEQISQRTSEMRAIPKRPPTMARIDTPPEMQRAPRPQQEKISPRSLHKRMIVGGGIIGILAIIGCIIGIVLANSISNSSGPSAAAATFLSTVNTQNYIQAYKDLGPAITLRTSQDQFINQAKSTDTCYGVITKYQEIPNSAKTSDNDQTYSFAYSVTRSKLAKAYTLQLTLQNNPDDNSWKVIDYGITLGPPQPAPACSK